MKPDVSVIIPTYDEPARVLSRSIQSALNQTIENIEIIVVDDSSNKNNSKAINAINDEEVTLIEHERNRGGSAARNTGANNSSGEYIAFLDADDEWRPTKLEEQLKYLENKPEDWTACYCGVKNIRSKTTKVVNYYSSQYFASKDSEETPKEGGYELIPSVLKGEFDTGGSSTILIRRETFNRINGWDESFPRHQDWEFMIRVLKTTKLAYVNQRLVLKHASSPANPESVIVSKKKYLDKFIEEIETIDGNIWDICNLHRHMLGELYLRNGKLWPALNYIDFSQIEYPLDILSLFWMYIRGLSVRVLDDSSVDWRNYRDP